MRPLPVPPRPRPLPRSVVRIVVGLAASALLAACGGGGGPNPQADRFASLESEGRRLNDLYGMAAPTPVADLPAGRATYAGVGAYSTSVDPQAAIASPDALSRVTLEADFDADTLTGSFSDFVLVTPGGGADSRAVDGALRLDDGTMAGGRIEGDLSGRLAIEGEVPANVAASLDGQVVGPAGEAITGEVRTTFVPGFDSQMSGVIVAER